MRQYIRHPSEMPINYQVVNGTKHSLHTRDNLYDVSSGGLSFHTRTPIEPGKYLHIKITVEPPPFEADGEVVWCHEDADGYQVGLKFEDADIDFSLRMIEQICHIEQYRNLIKRTEGRSLTSEQAAKEWISQFAGSFPY